MESFLYFNHSNNIGKWKRTVKILAQLNQGNRQCEQIRTCDTKERVDYLNQNESKVDVHWASWEEYQELKTPTQRLAQAKISMVDGKIVPFVDMDCWPKPSKRPG